MAEPSLQTAGSEDEAGIVRLAADERTFSTLEQAIRRTALGRWFIRETERRARTRESRDILEAIEGIRQSLDSQRSAIRLEVVKKELETMAEAIAQTRHAITSIQPETAGNNRIMAATEELDAIVTATERATSDILGAAEIIQGVSMDLRAGEADPGLCDKLDAQVTDIFTACTFQDITGQRTTKVVNVLRYLEKRVNSMIEIWGVEDEDEKACEENLLSGPAKEGEGASQEDIDKMLNDLFDG
ncbi:MAG: protein phosphatase CheZ [Alphaproteobacteria bacterium]